MSKILSLNKTLESIFLINILLASGSMLSVDYPVYRYGVVLVYVIMFSFNMIKINNNNNQIITSLIVFSILFISSISSFNICMPKSFIMIMILLTYVNGRSDNTFCFEFIMKFIFILSIISNILFLMHVFGLHVTRITTHIVNAPSAFYLMTPFTDEIFGLSGFRNAGIFWEPGVYMIYLNLYLIYFLYQSPIFSRKKIYRIVYIIISIYLTGSVIGWGICGITIAIYLLQKKGSALGFSIIAGISCLCILGPYLLKMYLTKKETTAYGVRVTDLLLGIQIFFKRPILGYGTSGVGSNFFAEQYAKIEGYPRACSNGIIQILLICGIVGFLFYLFFFIKYLFWYARQYSSKGILPLISWFILSLMDEPIGLSCFFFFLLALGAHTKIHAYFFPLAKKLLR